LPMAIQKLGPMTIQKFGPMAIQKFGPMTIQKFGPMAIQKFGPMTIQKLRPMAIQKLKGEYKMSLWKIKAEYETILNDIIDDDGIVSEHAEELLAINVEKRDDTATNYYHYINNLQYENGQIDEEIKRLQALKKRNKTKIELLSRSIIGLINLYGEFKSDLLNFKTRKSTVVEVDEDKIKELSEDYITTKTNVTPNKTAIKTALKNGLEINGCKLVEKHNLNVK